MNCFVQAHWFTWNAWKRTHFLTENLNSEEVYLEAFRACRLLIIDRSVIQKNKCKVNKKTRITKKNTIIRCVLSKLILMCALSRLAHSHARPQTCSRLFYYQATVYQVFTFFSDPSPIVGYSCQGQTNWLIAV